MTPTAERPRSHCPSLRLQPNTYLPGPRRRLAQGSKTRVGGLWDLSPTSSSRPRRSAVPALQAKTRPFGLVTPPSSSSRLCPSRALSSRLRTHARRSLRPRRWDTESLDHTSSTLQTLPRPGPKALSPHLRSVRLHGTEKQEPSSNFFKKTLKQLREQTSLGNVS